MPRVPAFFKTAAKPAPLQEPHRTSARQRWRRICVIAAQVLVALVFVYLVYQLFYTERGWIARRAVSEQVRVLEAEVEQLRQERDRLANRIQLLRDWSLDPDLLDEEALRELGFGQEGDILILLPDTGADTDPDTDASDSTAKPSGENSTGDNPTGENSTGAVAPQ